MNCLKCKSFLEFVCIDCCEEVCCNCDKKSKHLTHQKQKITCITEKCDSIKVQINDQNQFDQIKTDLSGTIEASMKVLESLSEIQLKFQKMVQDAEYHCELKRLARKFEEGIKKNQDDSTQQDTIVKIMTKSKKCGFNLSDSFSDKNISLNEIQVQLSSQQKISKQLEAEIKRLQNRIEGNRLFSVQDAIQREDDFDNTVIKQRQSKTLVEEEELLSSVTKRETRKRRGDPFEDITPMSKQISDQQTLKINKIGTSVQRFKDAPSPLLIKKLKKNLEQLY